MSEEQVSARELKENIVALGMSLKKEGAVRFFAAKEEHEYLVWVLRTAMREVTKREKE